MEAPERIWMFAENLRKYLPGGGKIMMGDTEYIRADVAVRDVRQVPEVAALIAAANDVSHSFWHGRTGLSTKALSKLQAAVRALDLDPSAEQSGEGLGEGIAPKIEGR